MASAIPIWRTAVNWRMSPMTILIRTDKRSTPTVRAGIAKRSLGLRSARKTTPKIEVETTVRHVWAVAAPSLLSCSRRTRFVAAQKSADPSAAAAPIHLPSALVLLLCQRYPSRLAAVNRAIAACQLLVRRYSGEWVRGMPSLDAVDRHAL